MSVERNAEQIVEALGGMEAVMSSTFLLSIAENASVIADASGISAALQYITKALGEECLWSVRAGMQNATV